MSQMSNKTKVVFSVQIELTEVEARALDALVGYGTDSFLATFYRMGEHYMKPYEGGIRSLFEAIKEQVRPELDRVDKARVSLGLSKERRAP